LSISVVRKEVFGKGSHFQQEREKNAKPASALSLTAFDTNAHHFIPFQSPQNYFGKIVRFFLDILENWM